MENDGFSSSTSEGAAPPKVLEEDGILLIRRVWTDILSRTSDSSSIASIEIGTDYLNFLLNAKYGHVTSNCPFTTEEQ